MSENVGAFQVRHQSGTAEGAGVTGQVAPDTASALGAGPLELGEILHSLNNVLVSIVLNAQIMEWKLPSYSHMRRNTHEIQRSARRAGVLLKRLSGRAAPPETSAVAKSS